MAFSSSAMSLASAIVASRASHQVRASAKGLTYVDVAAGMLDSRGEVRKDLFLKDDPHMNRRGYLVWRDVLRPILLKQELARERPKDGRQ